jgi:hypothetical protein
MKTPESLDVLRAEIRQHTYADEAETVIRLSERAETRLLPERRAAVLEQTRSLVSRCREHASEAGTLDAFLQEFGLSNPEGVALMCLAEALLRVPDSETADRLIAEKIRAGDWQSHLGQSDSLFVNGSVWGLMLTGSLIAPDEQATEDPGAWMMRLVSRLGEPLVRTAVVQAMRILGRQYVLGRTIEEAIERSRGQADRGNLYSFDMLGEGAASPSSCPPSTPATRKPSGTRSWRDCHRESSNWPGWPGSTGWGSASTRRNPPGSTCRSRSSSNWRRIRLWISGRVSASSCRPTRSGRPRWPTG